MIILGINLSHCSSITLIIDNEIKFFQEEERLSRVRRHKGWPKLSLEYMYLQFKIREQDIDYCVITDLQSSKNIPHKINAKKVLYLHHHLAHTFSGYVFCKNNDFSSISIDGGGDYNSWMSIGLFKNRKLKKWTSNCGFEYYNSKLKKPFFPKCFSKPIGTYWSHPSVLNFGMLDKNGIGGYEGKLMGLAARGFSENFINYKKKYNANFSLYKKSDFYFIKTSGQTKIGDKNFVLQENGERQSIKNVKILRKKNKILCYEYDLSKKDNLKFAADFAAYLQKETEKTVLECIRKNNFNKKHPLVLSGGLFSNVLMNGKINEEYNVIIVPTMGDEGLSIGAAAWAAYNLDIKLLVPENLFLGIKQPKNSDIDFKKISRLLKNNKIVGIIDGKMEGGPRALGGRSIIANPSWSGVNQTINQRLGRVEYMPFAPVILEEFANDILCGWKKSHISSQHMTLVYKVKNKWIERLSGVVHVDGTVRPQIINEKTNKVYFNILKSFYEETGVPVLINTSFNLHGEPIINDIQKARECLIDKKIDILVANNEIYNI